MLIKEYRPSDFNLMDPFPHLVKASSSRLRGNDLRDLKSKVGEFPAEFIKRALAGLMPGEVPLYIAAMGSTEITGPNRNSDGFKFATLQRRHPTFVVDLDKKSGAYVYRDHKNNDTSKSYGVTKSSIFEPSTGRVLLVSFLNGTKEAADRNGGLIADQEMDIIHSNGQMPVSMSCSLDPDTPILTDRGYIPISKIAVGDLVLTHKGRWRHVTELRNRPYTGSAVRLRMNGLPIDFELTSEHPFYAKVLADYPKSSMGKRQAQQWAAEIADGEEPFDWLHVRHLTHTDRIAACRLSPVPGRAGISDTLLAQLIGIYIAEGSLAYNSGLPKSVVLTVHVDDWSRTAVPEIVSQLWSDVTVTMRAKKNTKMAVELEIHSAEFARWCKSLAGVLSKEKRLAPEIINATEECKAAIMGRWLDGDGFIDAKGIHWSSANRGLILQGRDLLLSLGVSASIYRIRHTVGYDGECEEYTLNVSYHDCGVLVPFSQKLQNFEGLAGILETGRQRPPSLLQLPRGLAAYRVDSVEEFHVTDRMVYNFEVEEDQSYSMAGLASHNCRLPVSINARPAVTKLSLGLSTVPS
jgi:hypothetical protein